MTPYINAWLDCHSPHITVNDKETGELLVHYGKQDIAQLFQDGDISLDELQSTDTDIQEELIITLLLFKSTQALKQQISQARFDLKLRDPVIDIEPNRAGLASVPNKPTFQQTLQNLVAFPSYALQHIG